MTITIAITGKSGNGKTTVTKGLWSLIRENYPEKSILLFDNDLTSELGHSFGKDIRNTIFGIRSGKHEYKTGIPEQMTKQEYLEWALEDILQPLDDNTDIIVSWLVGSKDCRCPIAKQMNDAIIKLLKNYDIVLFDCEFDLKYLYQLVDIEIDVTLIVAQPNEESIHLAKRIEEFSAKHAAGNQMGVVLNKVKGNEVEPLYELLKKYSLDIIGVIPEDTDLKGHPLDKSSELIISSIKEFYPRLNIPQL